MNINVNLRYREFKDKLVQRIASILSTDGPLYNWECNICPYKDSCRFRSHSKMQVRELLLDEKYLNIKQDLHSPMITYIIRNIIEKNIGWAERKKPYFKPYRIGITSLVGCPLKVWFSLSIPYSTVLLDMKKNVIRGNLIHKGLQNILEMLNDEKCITIARKYGIIGFKSEIRTETIISIGNSGYHITGYIDGVIHREDKERVEEIIEIKTISSPDRTGNTKYNIPNPAHEAQLITYMYLYNETMRERGNRAGKVKGLLVYLIPSKDNHNLHIEEKQYLIDKNPKEFKDIINSFIEDINSIIEKDSWNETNIPRYKEECRLCPFKDLCQVYHDQRLTRRKKTQQYGYYYHNPLR